MPPPFGIDCKREPQTFTTDITDKEDLEEIKEIAEMLNPNEEVFVAGDLSFAYKCKRPMIKQ